MSNNPNTQKLQNNRGWYRKIILINKSGGGCEKCGYNKNISAIDFHHTCSTEQKNFNLDSRHLSNRSWDSILDEFEKCICVCSNCHREIHNPDRNMAKVKKRLDNTYDPRRKEKNRCIDCSSVKHSSFNRCKNCQNKCVDCGKLIYPNSKRCKKCHSKSQERIDWPSTDWLKRMCKEYSRLHLSKKLKVSDNAIKKRIKNH